MKKLHRFLYIVTIALVISAIAMFVAACSGTEEPAPPKQYTLTFKLDENTDYDSYTGVKGSEVTRKPDPTDATARFEGWSTEPNGDIVEVPTVMPAEDQTYYAVFARYYNITLNAGAGTLDDAQKRLESKAEQSIYSIVKDVVPTAPGSAEFDGWYYNNVKLTDESKDVMPAKNIALDAKYSIGYTVNIHVQEKFGEDGEYKEDASKKIVGKGLVGATVRTSEYPKLDGYAINDEKSGDTAAFVLNATSNIFNIYYGKTGYSVMFAGNAPEENLTVKGDAINEQWGYGDVHTMPKCPYTISGYRFSYWSENADGSGKKYYVGDEYSVRSTTMIYAVWVKGYVDSSGMSPDIVYLDDNNKEGKKIAYLSRTYNEEIVGSYTKQSDGACIFFFNDGSSTSPTIKGAALPDSNKFIYYMDDAYVLRYIGKAEDTFMNALNRDVTLTIPMMDTVVNKKYTAVYKEGSTEITGSYSYEEEQDSLKFTSENKEFYFRLSQTIAGDTGLTQNVFEIRGDEYGMWHNMNALEEVDAHYNIVLDGYGTAQMVAVGLNSSFSQTNAVSTTNGIYRYTANYTAEKREIAVQFTSSSGLRRTFVCMLLDGKNYGTTTTPIEKVYVERSVTAVYAKPEGDNVLDIQTADKFEFDGYGLSDGSAKFISGTTETIGKYYFDAKTLSFISRRPLQFTFTPEGGDEKTYELSIAVASDDNAYYVYEAVDKTLYGDYAIMGLEPTFTPGTHYKLRIYNNGRAEMVLTMPYQDTVYGNKYWDYLTVASGKIEAEGDEYHFVGELDETLVYQAFSYYYQIFNAPINISNFGNFKFSRTSASTGTVTGIGDNYAGITFTYEGDEYVTDGYGNAKVVGNDKKTKSYTVGTNGGISWLRIRWTEKVDEEEVSKSQLYHKVDGTYLQVKDSYASRNANGETLYLYVLDGDSAVMGYLLNGSVYFYATGSIKWENTDKKYGEFTYETLTDSNAWPIAVRFGESFKFGLTTEQSNDTTVNVFYMYDSGSVTDGVSTINGENGEKLIIDRVKYEAEYKVPNADAEGGYDSVKSAFTFYDGIITITKTEEEKTTSLSFKLVYNEEATQVEKFVKIGEYAGIWKNIDGTDSYMYLTGELIKDSQYKGYYMRNLNESGEPEVQIEGTYVRTDYASNVEYKFTYVVRDENGDAVKDEDGKDVVDEVYFVVGFVRSTAMPAFQFRDMTELDWTVYSSFENAEKNIAVGKLSGGAYSAQTFTYNGGKLTGYVYEYDDVIEQYKDCKLYAFVNTSGTTTGIAFFFLLDKDKKAYMLDSTFRRDNLGQYACSKNFTVELPATEEAKAKTITVKSVYFDGLGKAELTTVDDEKYTVSYGLYSSSTSTYRFMALNDEDKYVHLLFFRLNVDADKGIYAVVAEDVALTQYIHGDGYSVLLTDGFSVANYVDRIGRIFAGVYARVPDHPELIAFVYSDGSNRVVYFEVDAENKTFTVVGYDDTRISTGDSEEEGEDDEGSNTDAEENNDQSSDDTTGE